MSILNKKVWRLGDIVKTDGDKTLLSVLKVTHPFRQQRIILIPVPRYALEEYYNDWVYQPYTKEHVMYVSNDIFNPTYVFSVRSRLKRDKFPGYAYFHPMGFPDCIELNLTRREFISREQPLRTPMLLILLTLTSFRDKYHPWVRRRVRALVGDRYVTHPGKNAESLVLVLPPAYVPAAVNELQALGFRVDDSTSAVGGDSAQLTTLKWWSEVGQRLVMGYLWFMISLLVVNESRRIYGMFQDYKREMVELAGKDPEKMGL